MCVHLRHERRHRERKPCCYFWRHYMYMTAYRHACAVYAHGAHERSWQHSLVRGAVCCTRKSKRAGTTAPGTHIQRPYGQSTAKSTRGSQYRSSVERRRDIDVVHRRRAYGLGPRARLLAQLSLTM